MLDGFNADGSPRLRAPKREITTRMLLLHTAGFGYDFFNENYNRLATDHKQPSVIAASRASIETPLLFDHGERWEYGSNIDWAGPAIEGITGKRLGEVMQERIFDPLGMDSSAFTMSPAMRSKIGDDASAKRRRDDGVAGRLHAAAESGRPYGRTWLDSTPLDYAKFIRIWLNDGNGPQGRILKPETVRMAEQNGFAT